MGFRSLVQALLHLKNLVDERTSEKKVMIYPLTEDNKLITGVEPFVVNADCGLKQVQISFFSNSTKLGE